MPEEAQHGSNGIGIAESRAHSRSEVHSLAYVELGDGNAGILLNISETGLAVQTIQILGSDQFPQIAFRLPKTDTRIEVSGKVVWQIRSKKQAGIQLVEVPDTARSAIKSWMTAEQARRVETADETQPDVQPSGVEAALEPVSHRGAIDPRLTAPRPPVGPARAQAVLAAVAPVSRAAPNAAPQTSAAASSEPLRSSAPGTSNLPSVLRPSGTVPQFRYVPLAGAVDLRRPGRWWTYLATIGVLAAIAFAALMTFDPEAITRARNAALVHLQEGNASTQTVDQTQQPATAAQPSSTNAEGAPAANSTTDGAAAGAQGTLPTVLPGDSDTPPASASGGNAPGPNSTSPTSGSPVPSDGATGLAPNDSLSESAGASSSTAEPARAARSNPEEEHKRLPVDAQQTGTRDRSQLTSGAGNVRSASQNQAPYMPANSGYRPSNNSPSSRAVDGSGSTAVPSMPKGAPNRSETQTPAQADQDAYAARRNSPTSPPANIPTGPQEPKSIDMPSAYSSPVLPSVPISGIPSGSVAANSQFRGIRIPPELESQSSQLGGKLQIGQLLSSYSPAYPTDAARAGVEGTVRLSVIVGRDGTVKTVQVLDGPAMLAPVAAAAVRNWRYAETFLAGQPIETTQYVTIVFRLSKPAER